MGTGDCGELLCGAGTGALSVVQEKRKMIKYFNWKSEQEVKVMGKRKEVERRQRKAQLREWQ